MRVLSLSPAVTEIIAALGKGTSLVGRDQFSDYPETILSVPVLKGHTKVSAVAAKDLHPDLVFTSTIIQEKLAAELKAAGLSVVHFNTRTVQDIYDSIQQVGILLEVEDQAQVLIKRMKTEFMDIAKRAKLLPRKPKVYSEEWPNPPMVSGNWVPELIREAGGTSFPIQPGTLSREVTLSELVAFDPDLIIVSWCGAGEKGVNIDVVRNRPGWDQLRAVQSGAIRVINDSYFNRPGPRVTEGSQRLYGFLFEILH